MTKNAIANEIVDAAFRIHTALGPGLPSRAALRALSMDFKKKILTQSRQAAKTCWDASTPAPWDFKGAALGFT